MPATPNQRWLFPLERHLTQDNRRRWVELLLAAADELGMPDDPEFRSALVGYLEWGATLDNPPSVAAPVASGRPCWT